MWDLSRRIKGHAVQGRKQAWAEGKGPGAFLRRGSLRRTSETEPCFGERTPLAEVTARPEKGTPAWWGGGHMHGGPHWVRQGWGNGNRTRASGGLLFRGKPRGKFGTSPG